MSIMADNVVRTSRLTLVQFTKDDLEAYHTVSSDPGAHTWSLHGRRETIEDSANWFPSILRDAKHDGRRSWAVYMSDQLDQEDCIGRVSFIPKGRVAQSNFQTWELGYIIREKFWGQGYATEALMAAVEDLKRELDLQREGGANIDGKIVAWVGPENKPSLRVMKKAGFEFAQHLNFGGHDWWLGGQWVEDGVYVFEKAV